MITPGTRPVAFELLPEARRSILEAPVLWRHGGLGEVTFRRTYSRLRGDGRREDWGDTVLRVIEGQWTILRTHCELTGIPWDEARGQRLALEAAQRMHTMKWLPPGRGLWMMGTDYIWQRGSAALNNCAFVSTERLGESPEETIEPFRFLMDVAMLGVGPGFDVRGAGKVGVRGADGAPVVYRVPDTREGWVEAIARTIRAEIYGGGPIVLDVQDVRTEGLPLRGFGGVASGPGPLLRGQAGVQALLRARRGREIDSTTIVDIMNVIGGKIVVAGNIRRTAEIAMAPASDSAFAQMKNWRENGEAVGAAPPAELREASSADYDEYADAATSNNRRREIEQKWISAPWSWKFGGWRWASNNSIFADVGMDYRPHGDSIAQAGEPGFAWLDLMRQYGRMKDPPNGRDHRVMGANPCTEQSLESYEMCNLVENLPAHAEDYWDFQRSLKFSYLYAKTVTLMGTHWRRTNEVMARNRRIGCSMSGVVDAIQRVGRTKFFQDWCERGYRYVQYVDQKYAEWLGVRPSIKTTSMKPSGTVSLVAGAYGPGGHWPKSDGYRTMRLAAGGDVERALRRAGYRLEPARTDPSGTTIAYFPWLLPEGMASDQDVGLWEQVAMAADLQYWWADNQVSYTATFSREEGERGEIARVLTAYDGRLKGISFLSKEVGNYDQMPFTAAPRAEVLRYASGLLPIQWDLEETRVHEADDKFCDSEKCEIPGAAPPVAAAAA